MNNQTNAHISARIPTESPQLLPALLRMLADDLEQNGGKPEYKLDAASLTLRIVHPLPLPASVMSRGACECADVSATDELGLFGL